MSCRAPLLISSLDDPRLEPYRDVREKDLRGRDHLFMAESELVLRRLLRTPERLHSLLLTPQKFELLADALDVLADDVPVYVAPLDQMTRIAGFHIHRGVLAAGFRPTPRELAVEAVMRSVPRTETMRVLLLEGVTNVDNMGGLFRNARAFGFDAVVLDPACCDPLYRKAIRVSMGHVLSVPWAVSGDWPADLLRLKEAWDLTLIGAERRREAIPVWEIPKGDRLGVLMGSEGHGLSEPALGTCDVVAEIPMTDGVPSLNVAAAAAVFMYELTRP